MAEDKRVMNRGIEREIVMASLAFDMWRNVMIMCPYAPRGWPAV